MKEKILKDITSSLSSGEDEVRNGSIIGALASNGYRDFDFDFKTLEKVSERHYSHKIAILSLSFIIKDKKIRKRYLKLVNKYVKDGYSSVRRAAAFSEPGFWSFEKGKNQEKKIKNLIKNSHKLDESYLEGVLIGIGINAQDFDPEIYDDAIDFFEKIIEFSANEKIAISLCYGISMFAVITNNINKCIPLLKEISSKVFAKRAKTAVAEALSFLTGHLEFDESLEVIDILIKNPAYQKSWPLNLSILLAYLNNIDSNSVKSLTKKIRENVNELEVIFLLDLLEKKGNPLEVLTDCLTSEFSQLKLAALFATYFAEHHKDKLKKKEKDFEKFADLIVDMLGDSSGVTRSFALYRLLSYSLTLKTDKYIDLFNSGLRDQINRNRLVSAIAISYLTLLMRPEKFPEVREELYATKDPLVKKGLFIGMGMGINPAINESENADELILGLLELSGEATNIGFILTINNYE